MDGPPTDPPAVLLCGEVRTGLLPARDAVDERTAARLLRLRADERVRLSRRPVRHAVSPDVLTGVDCRLPAADARIRAVGTVAARAVLVEGRVLQTTAHFRLPSAGDDRRRPWGHYLVRPGLLVPVGRFRAGAVADGHLAGRRPDELDTGAIAEALAARISRRRELDHDPPLRTPVTALRWSALPATEGTAPSLSLTVDDRLRTLRLRIPGDLAPALVAAFCEDLALHDWLLTTVGDRLDGLRPATADDTALLATLRPLVDHLLHLWLPRARLDSTLAPLWDVLEDTTGFTRQWESLAQRIRDQLAIRALTGRTTAEGTGR
ncbi:SCO2521 family protein [Streptomyces sp. NPDC005017]|uniref:SCO2521 family protein n=1 Tax=Streptomyces sp. NPDC005017 TaxID=3364706 RepID=UPI0036C749B5